MFEAIDNVLHIPNPNLGDAANGAFAKLSE
jgi:hypothetical protein